jgi:dTDP-4-dehydrorhamnose reductase
MASPSSNRRARNKMTESQAKGKLLIFGGTGFVGGHLAAVASKTYEVIVVGRSAEAPESLLPPDGPLAAAAYYRCDPADREAVAALVEQIEPAAVVNTAAISAIDYAEKHQDEAYQANVVAAGAIAAAAQGAGARHVYLSSDAVFSGEDVGYSEEDTPAPVNYYGRTKAQAEEAVVRACPGASIIRVSLILGFPVTEAGGFLQGLRKKMHGDASIRAPDFEYRSPVDVVTLCEVILELLDRNDVAGIWHVAATEFASRYEITRMLVSELGGNESAVERQTTPSGDPTRAPRHRNGILSVDKAGSKLQTPMPTLGQAIRRAINTKGAASAP